MVLRIRHFEVIVPCSIVAAVEQSGHIPHTLEDIVGEIDTVRTALSTTVSVGMLVVWEEY